MLERAGLLERVIYDPSIHGEVQYCDPGDEIWSWVETGTNQEFMNDTNLSKDERKLQSVRRRIAEERTGMVAPISTDSGGESEAAHEQDSPPGFDSRHLQDSGVTGGREGCSFSGVATGLSVEPVSESGDGRIAVNPPHRDCEVGSAAFIPELAPGECNKSQSAGLCDRSSELISDGSTEGRAAQQQSDTPISKPASRTDTGKSSGEGKPGPTSECSNPTAGIKPGPSETLAKCLHCGAIRDLRTVRIMHGTDRCYICPSCALKNAQASKKTEEEKSASDAGMQREEYEDGGCLILCTNHACGSNGGDNFSAIPFRAELAAVENKWKEELTKSENKRKETAKDFEAAFRVVRKENESLTDECESYLHTLAYYKIGNEELKKSLEEARKDRERLDWLASRGIVTGFHQGSDMLWRWTYNMTVRFNTLREAIDAAIAESKEGK